MNDTPQILTLASAARLAWEGSETNDDAANKLLALAEQHPNVMEELTRPRLYGIALACVIQHKTKDRSALRLGRTERAGAQEAPVVAAPEPAPAPAPCPVARERHRVRLLAAAVQPAVRVAVRSFLNDWRLSGGKPLGDANRAEVMEEAQRRLTVAATYRTDGTFLTRVAGAMSTQGRVRDTLSEADLTRFYQDAAG